jgi:hypothetical protein
MWQRNMDSRFLFEKGLYCYYLSAGNYLLSHCIIMNENMFAKEPLTKENMLMITMLLRKSEIGVMFFWLYFCVVENSAKRELDSGARLQ